MDPKLPPLAVTDTHALIWAIDGDRKRLGKNARRQFENADDGKCSIYIPAVVLVELGEACHTERVTLSLAFEEWTRLAFASGKYHEAALTARRLPLRLESNAYGVELPALIDAPFVGRPASPASKPRVQDARETGSK